MAGVLVERTAGQHRAADRVPERIVLALAVPEQLRNQRQGAQEQVGDDEEDQNSGASRAIFRQYFDGATSIRADSITIDLAPVRRKSQRRTPKATSGGW